MKQLRVNTPDLQQYQKHENLNDHLIMVCDIIALAWQAQPRVLIGLFLLQIIQGTAPIVNAIINKYIFDILGHYSIGITTSSVPRNLINWLIALALINLISQSLGVVNGYISSELTRQITTRVQVFVSEKINSLHGLAPFETPHWLYGVWEFHWAWQPGMDGAGLPGKSCAVRRVGASTFYQSSGQADFSCLWPRAGSNRSAISCPYIRSYVCWLPGVCCISSIGLRTIHGHG